MPPCLKRGPQAKLAIVPMVYGITETHKVSLSGAVASKSITWYLQTSCAQSTNGTGPGVVPVVGRKYGVHWPDESRRLFDPGLARLTPFMDRRNG